MKNDRLAVGYGLIAVLLWSTVATAFKLTLSYMSVTQMLAGASAISASVLLLIAVLQGKIALVIPTFISRPHYWLILGFINPFTYYLILFESYNLLPASIAQPLNYTWAITLTLLSSVFLHQHIRKQDWIAIIISYIGVIIIATQGNPFQTEINQPIGIVFALLSTLLWAGFWILNAKNQADPVIGLLLSFLISLPFSFFLAGFDDWQLIPWQGWAAMTYVGLFEMGVTFLIWLKAMKLTSNTAKVSNLIFISPFISLLLLTNIIGEQIHPTTLIGLMMIVAGLLIQQKKKKN